MAAYVYYNLETKKAMAFKTSNIISETLIKKYLLMVKFCRYVLCLGLVMAFLIVELIGFVSGISMFATLHSLLCIL